MRVLWRSFLFLLPLSGLSSGQSLKTGEPAPPLALEQTIPAAMNTAWSALRGKPVVLEFWSTWCANCVAEIRHLNELVKNFPGIRFLSVTDEPRTAVEPFLAQQPILGWVGIDHQGATFKAYGVEARPQTILIDEEGVLRGILHPAQVDEAVLTDLAEGRPVQSHRLNAPLGMFDDTTTDPVFAVMLRPSNRAKPGGVFGVDPGKLEGESVALKTILSYAYEIGLRRLEGPEHLLSLRFDFCVLLPEGATGDTALLRDMLERSFQLKLRHESRVMDALVLKLAGEKPAESPGAAPMSMLAVRLESRWNRAVVNETGLTGRYKFFDLPEENQECAAALRAKFGIAVVEERRPVDVLVIESMELPQYRIAMPGR